MTVPGDVTTSDSSQTCEVATLLLGTTREWFASALEAVLHSEGFRVVRAGSGGELLSRTEEIDPDLVMVDESLADVHVPTLCRELTDDPLPAHIPLVVYTQGYAGDVTNAESLDAGAWEILNEPIRAQVLISVLHRLLDLSRQMESKPERPLWDEKTGLFTEAGLKRMLPSLRALADRSQVGMCCVVLGPTQPGRGDVLERQRTATADLCSVNVRVSDVCGWLESGELAIIAFDTPTEGAATLAERLNRVASGRAEISGESRTLSAGIVELVSAANHELEGVKEKENRRTVAGPRGSEIRTERLEAARAALVVAREHGGGIRVAEVA